MSPELHIHIYNCLFTDPLKYQIDTFKLTCPKLNFSVSLPLTNLFHRESFHFSFKWMTNAFSHSEKHIGFILDFFPPLTSISDLLEILLFILKYIQNSITSQNFHCYCLDTKTSLLSQLVP